MMKSHLNGTKNVDKISIRFFNNYQVRAVWYKNKWWFSVIDIVSAINQQNDRVKSSNYWRWLKKKLIDQNVVQFVSDTHRLKIKASDGKLYSSDVINSEEVMTLVKHFPNTNAIKFLDWFVYSNNSIDEQSKKKAYTFWESNLINDKEVGTTKALQKIHAYIFGGLYKFAGQIRQVTISKDGFTFAPAHFLNNTLLKIEQMSEDTFDDIIKKYVEMNIAHPFMEGNGRSTRIWLDLILKKRLRKCADWSKIDKNDYLSAMRESYKDSSKINGLIKNALTNKIYDREIFMKGIDYSYYYEEIDQDL